MEIPNDSQQAVIEAYDVNFCFPVRVLENERVKLTPFIPSVHAETFFSLSAPHPELYDYLPFGPFPTLQSFISDLLPRIQRNPAATLFAVLDKTRSPNSDDPDGSLTTTFAGIIGLLCSEPHNLKTEIGFVTTLPAFQHTHVTSNAIGLLLHYALDFPSQGGLGLRRVQWQTNQLNSASIRVAQKLGFRMEGILKWDRVLPEGKIGNGKKERQGDVRKGCPGRDTAMLSICWDDWEVQRDLVEQIMDRR